MLMGLQPVVHAASHLDALADSTEEQRLCYGDDFAASWMERNVRWLLPCAARLPPGHHNLSCQAPMGLCVA
jgi:hypothetical protein